MVSVMYPGFVVRLNAYLHSNYKRPEAVGANGRALVIRRVSAAIYWPQMCTIGLRCVTALGKTQEYRLRLDRRN